MNWISNLPNEILSIIFRSATLDEFSIQTTYEDPCVIATYRFTEYERSQSAIKTKSSISRVCTHWNEINARFLCEYVYISHTGQRGVLDRLARCLSRLSSENGGTIRGNWTKRIDICLDDFEGNWYTQYFDDEEEGPIELYGWQHILSLTPNATIVSLFEGPTSAPSDWSTEVFFSLSTLSRLRRVEWDGTGSDMSDLQQLSVLCPSLTHIAFTLTASGGGDMDASTDAFEITFPQAETLMLKWDQTEHPMHVYPPFQPWQLPSLKHLTFYLRDYSPFRLGRELVQGVGNHLKSLELPVLGRNTVVSLPDDFFTLVPAMEIFILDVFKTLLPAFDQASHANLHTLGLRLRMSCSLFDIRNLEACHRTFSREAFPALEKVRIVHPHDFGQYAHFMTPPLLSCWLTMMEDPDWVPILTFDGDTVPLSTSETGPSRHEYRMFVPNMPFTLIGELAI
jgi:hypothetical protein